MQTYHKSVVSFLMDGRYHTLAEIYEKVADEIPAKAALVEYDRKTINRKSDPESRKVRVVKGGQRLVLLSMLSLVHHREMVEVGRGRGLDRQYRMFREAISTVKHRAKERAKRELELV